MPGTEKKVKPRVNRIRCKEVRVITGCSPEGKLYFSNKKVPIITPENSGNFQPTIEELPPTDEPLFKTKEGAKKYALKQKMERDWEKATSKKGRPPIGGAQDN